MGVGGWWWHVRAKASAGWSGKEKEKNVQNQSLCFPVQQGTCGHTPPVRFYSASSTLTLNPHANLLWDLALSETAHSTCYVCTTCPHRLHAAYSSPTLRKGCPHCPAVLLPPSFPPSLLSLLCPDSLQPSLASDLLYRRETDAEEALDINREPINELHP